MTIETFKSPNASSEQYFLDKMEIFIRLFDEHFACQELKTLTVPQISLETPPPPPPVPYYYHYFMFC